MEAAITASFSKKNKNKLLQKVMIWIQKLPKLGANSYCVRGFVQVKNRRKQYRVSLEDVCKEIGVWQDKKGFSEYLVPRIYLQHVMGKVADIIEKEREESKKTALEYGTDTCTIDDIPIFTRAVEGITTPLTQEDMTADCTEYKLMQQAKMFSDQLEAQSVQLKVIEDKLETQAAQKTTAITEYEERLARLETRFTLFSAGGRSSYMPGIEAATRRRPSEEKGLKQARIAKNAQRSQDQQVRGHHEQPREDKFKMSNYVSRLPGFKHDLSPPFNEGDGYF